MFPNLAHAAVFYVFEDEAGNHFCGVAGQRFAARRDEHQLAGPAAHAGFGIFGVIVGNDVFDANLSFEAFLFVGDKCERLIELFARGQEVFAIRESPSVILDVGEFDACGAGRFGDGEHFFKLINVAAVNDEVQGDGDTMLPEPLEDAEFLFVGTSSGDFVGDFFAGALEAELKMVETGFNQRGKFWLVEGQAGSDEVDVKAGGASGADEIKDVGAGERLAAGEIGLEDAYFGGFLEDAGPGFGGEFFRAGLEFERVGAVDAVERAAVGELGD